MEGNEGRKRRKEGRKEGRKNGGMVKKCQDYRILKKILPFFKPKNSNSQSIGLLNVGDATRIQPKTSNNRARHFTGVIFLPNNITANAAVVNIFNYPKGKLHKNSIKGRKRKYGKK